MSLVEFVNVEIEMKLGLPNFSIAVVILSSLNAVLGIRFVIDIDECFSHNVQYEGDTVHVSFVVIKVDTAWQYTQEGVDLVVSPLYVSVNDTHGSLCSSNPWSG